MRAYVVRRLLVAVPTLAGMSFASFALAHLAPGDPARDYGEIVLGQPPTTAQLAEFRHELRLDRPFAVQYLSWLGGALRGDLGTSFTSRQPVSEELARRVPATFALTAAAALVVVLAGVPAGLVAALRHRKPVDHVLRAVSLAGASLPSFWLGLLLIVAFSVHFDVFPASGRGGLDNLVLPTIALAVGPAAFLSRFTRSAVLEVLGQDHLLTARAKGLRPMLVFGRHALRTALVPVLTVFGLLLGHLLAGAVVVEKVFVWPGVGTLMLDAVERRNYPVIQGVVLFAGTSFVVVNLLVDLCYGLIDPRARLGQPADELV